MSLFVNYLKIFKFFIISISLCSKLNIDHNDKFPIHMNSSFRIVFESKKVYSPYTIMKLQIVNGQSFVSNLFIYPGISDKLENRLSDMYMSVEEWYKDSYSAINMYIKFFPISHNMTFEILYYEPNNSDERKKVMNNQHLMQRIFSQVIELKIDPTLEFFIATKDGRKDGVINEDIAIISCQSRKGVPPSRPELSYINKLKLKSRKFIEEENRIVVHFYVLKKNHNKYVKCSSAGTSEYRYIKVFHHPTSLTLSPAYSTSMPNGSSVICRSVDGYPTPSISWLFIEGPPNSSQFYTVNGNNLTILPNCPLETHWKFNCSAINSIPGSYDSGATRAFVFIVSRGTQVARVVVGVLVSVLVVFIIIIILVKKRSIMKRFKSSKTQKNLADSMIQDGTQNNFNNSYYTYSQDSEVEIDTKKKKRTHRRKPKKEITVGSVIDECIV